jgi:hypothetical protein
MAGASAASKKKQQVPHKTSVKKQGTLCDKIWAKIDSKTFQKFTDGRRLTSASELHAEN